MNTITNKGLKARILKTHQSVVNNKKVLTEVIKKSRDDNVLPDITAKTSHDDATEAPKLLLKVHTLAREYDKRARILKSANDVAESETQDIMAVKDKLAKAGPLVVTEFARPSDEHLLAMFHTVKQYVDLGFLQRHPSVGQELQDQDLSLSQVRIVPNSQVPSVAAQPVYTEAEHRELVKAAVRPHNKWAQEVAEKLGDLHDLHHQCKPKHDKLQASLDLAQQESNLAKEKADKDYKELERRLRESEATLEQCSTSLEIAQGDVEQKAHRIQTLEEQLANVEAEQNANATETIAELRAEAEEKQRAIDEMAEAMQKVEGELEIQIQQQAQHEQQSVEFNTLTGKYAELETRADELEKAQLKASKELDKQTEVYNALVQGTIPLIRRQRNEAEKKCKTLRQEHDAAVQKLEKSLQTVEHERDAALQGQLALEAALVSLEQKLVEEHQKLSRTRQTLASRREHVRKTKEQVKNLQTHMTHLVNQRSRMAAQLRASRTARDEAVAEAAERQQSLEAAVASLEHKLVDEHQKHKLTRHVLVSRRAHARKTKEQVTCLQKNMTQLVNRQSAMTAQLRTARTERDEAEAASAARDWTGRRHATFWRGPRSVWTASMSTLWP